MPDISLEWDNDFRFSPSGDLTIADGDIYARQRISRRLFTAVRGYIWHQEYGAGLPQKIGNTMRLQELTSIVRSQIALEQAVSAAKPPKINVTQEPGGLFIIEIGYTAADTKQQIALTITA